MSVVVTTVVETLIRVTPVFSGGQSLSASGLAIDWFIMNTCGATGNPQISTINFNGGI